MAKIVFFGTPLFAKLVLEILAPYNDIVAVVTQPDRPFGRKKELKISEVKELAISMQIPCFQPEKLHSSLLEELATYKPDFFVVVAFGQIFPKAFLDFCPCINLHASILPQFRGASPIQEMILQDKKQFGVSAMCMQEGLDSGEILGISLLNSNQDLNLSELSFLLANLGGNLMLRVLREYGFLAPLKQIHCDSSVCKKIKKEDGQVDFLNAREIFVRFLAFSPWPGIFLENGLKILTCAIEDLNGSYLKGKIIKITCDSVLVGCNQGVLKIYEVQPPSKTKMSVLDYLRGKHLKEGDIFC